MRAYFRFALIAVLLAGIACFSAIVTMQFAVHRTEVQIPDLKGMPVDEATSRAAGLGLDVSVTERFYSTALPAGRVLLQTPAPGSSVRRGWDLAVAESLGPQKIAIPNVLGKSEHDAILLIRQKGLDLGAIAHLPDARQAAGTVLAQDPGPEAKGAERPSVSLLVASPDVADEPAWVMPEEKGKPYTLAAAELAKSGLTVESATGAPAGAQVVLTPGTAARTVLAQTPPSGARVDHSSRIVLWISGPEAGAAATAAASTPVAPGSRARVPE